MTIRVLIVEDSAQARDALTDLLNTRGGFRVVGTAEDEMDATEWLHGHAGGWEVAIFDLLIAAGSGFNLIARAKQSPRAGKAVVFSAYATAGVSQRCLELGADAAFCKTQTDQLLQYLEGLKTDQPRLMQQRPH